MQLAKILESSVRQRRDAGARYAGAKYCSSVLTTGVGVPLNPLRRDYQVGFAVVVAGDASDPIVTMLRQALYSVTTAEDVGDAMGQVDEGVQAGDGSGGGLLLVHHSCAGGLNQLASMAPIAGGLPEQLVVVLVGPADATAVVPGSVLSAITGYGNKLSVLSEPLQASDVAQLCWVSKNDGLCIKNEELCI